MKQIKVSDLTLRVKDKLILDSINMEINEKDTVAILGPNGSGKTTLSNVMLNLQRFKNGTLKNDFLDLPAYKIGVHMQESKLNGLMKVKEVLDLFLFEGDNKSLIDKYDFNDKLNQRIATLSGGEKQKLLLILTFQNNPELVFIDEVTTGLDVQSRQSIIKFLKKEMEEKHKTLVMITHYLEEADALCNKLAFLKKGKLIEYGEKESLYNKYHILKTVLIETIGPVKLPEQINGKSITENRIEIEVKDEKDMIRIMNFISENNTKVKKYIINEPSIECLYNRIIQGDEKS